MNADTMTLEEVRALLIENTVRNRRGTIACPAWAICVRDAIDAAIKQREQDKRDAARYRWLREGDNDEKVMSRSGEDWDDVFVLRREKLDAAIDAAMAKESGK